MREVVVVGSDLMRGGHCWKWPYERGGRCWEWPYERGGRCWEWPYKRWTTVYYIKTCLKMDPE